MGLRPRRPSSTYAAAGLAVIYMVRMEVGYNVLYTYIVRIQIYMVN